MTGLPFRWYPDHTKSQWHTPAPGDLIANDHTVWRVLDVRPLPQHLWDDHDRHRVASSGATHAPQAVFVRPAQSKETGPAGRDGDLFFHTRPRGHQWNVYIDEHYPVCVQCGEPTPCRERVGERVAAAEMADMTRYETPGVCPACTEPVTRRQKYQTFQENTQIPGGAPVTFHIGRRQCAYEAAEYAKTCTSSASADLFGGAV